MTRNKQTVIDAIAGKTGLSKKDSEAAMSAFLDVLLEVEADKGDKSDLRLVGFGTFYRKDTKEKKGINPKTKQPLIIPAKTSLAFRRSKPAKPGTGSKKK